MINRKTRRHAAVLAILALAAGGIVVAPTAASAQAGAADEYSPTSPGNGSGGSENDGTGGAVDDNLGAGTAESDGGNLPFTGYPLTPLVTLFLLLLAAGLVIRLAGSRRSRNELPADRLAAP